jgi:hypothetical protein
MAVGDLTGVRANYTEKVLLIWSASRRRQDQDNYVTEQLDPALSHSQSDNL